MSYQEEPTEENFRTIVALIGLGLLAWALLSLVF
jgi:hypothetical protein